MSVSDMDFVFHGPLSHTIKAFKHPENDSSIGQKPLNVLWTSPIDPKTGKSAWSKYLETLDGRFIARHYQGVRQWHIVPTEKCRILELTPDSPEFEKYVVEDKNKFCSRSLDFEAIAKDYDALYVPEETIFSIRDDELLNNTILERWDCSTCVFFREYHVMDDTRYALYKKGEYKPSSVSRDHYFENIEVNLQPRIITPLKKKKPVDYSTENAVLELEALLKQSRNNTKRRRDKNYHIKKTILMLKKGTLEDEINESILKYPDIVEILLKHGMKPDIDSNGLPIELYRCTTNPKVVKTFLQYGLDENKFLNVALNEGFRPLSWIKLAISAGADPNRPNEKGIYPIMMSSNPEITEYLISVGADPKKTDQSGKSVADHLNSNSRYYHKKVLQQVIIKKAQARDKAK